MIRRSRTKRVGFHPVPKARTELEGPFECGQCGGHMMLDATFLEQVSDKVTCPYCKKSGRVKGIG